MTSRRDSLINLIQDFRGRLETDNVSESISGGELGEWFKKINTALYEVMPDGWENKYPHLEELMCGLEPDVDMSSVMLRNHKVTSLQKHNKIIDQEAFHDRLVDRQQEKGLKLEYCGEMNKADVIEILDQIIVALPN